MRLVNLKQNPYYKKYLRKRSSGSNVEKKENQSNELQPIHVKNDKTSEHLEKPQDNNKANRDSNNQTEKQKLNHLPNVNVKLKQTKRSDLIDAANAIDETNQYNNEPFNLMQSDTKLHNNEIAVAKFRYTKCTSNDRPTLNGRVSIDLDCTGNAHDAFYTSDTMVNMIKSNDSSRQISKNEHYPPCENSKKLITNSTNNNKEKISLPKLHK